MNIHDMTEVAYKNGYEAGVKQSEAKIKELEAMLEELEKFNNFVLAEKSSLEIKLIRQRNEIEKLTEELDGETTENMRLKHEVERLQKQETTIAKMYYKLGVKDLAKRVKQEINFPIHVWNVFDNIVKELVEGK